MLKSILGGLGLGDMNLRQLLTQGVNLGEELVFSKHFSIVCCPDVDFVKCNTFFGSIRTTFFISARAPSSARCLPINRAVIELHFPPAGLIVTTALMIWKGLVLFTGSESPVSHSSQIQQKI